MALRGTTSYESGAAATSGTITYAGANSIQVGDVIVAIVYQQLSGTAAYTDPSGWSSGSSISLPDARVSSDNNYHVAVKIAGASDAGTPTYTWSTSYSGYWMIQLRVYYGRVNSSISAAFPNNVATAAGASGNTPYAYPLTGLTANAGDDLIAGVMTTGAGGSNVGSATAISGFSNAISSIDVGGALGGVVMSLDQVNAAAGATGTLTASITTTSAETITPIGFVMALPQAAAAPTPKPVLSGGKLLISNGKVLTGALLFMPLSWSINRRNKLAAERRAVRDTLKRGR